MVVLTSFDISTMNTLGNILLIGRRNSGKTVLALDIISSITRQGIKNGNELRINDPSKLLKRVLVMSGSEAYNKTFSNKLMLNENCICHGFDPDFLRIAYNHARESAKVYGDNNPSQGTLLVLEDLAFDPQFYAHPIIKEIIFNGRHFNLTLLILMQEPSLFPKKLRSNIDYVFTTKSCAPQVIDNLYDFYFGAAGWASVKEFRDTLDLYTNNNNVLCIDMTRKESSEVGDKVFYYHADYIIDGLFIDKDDPRHPEYIEDDTNVEKHDNENLFGHEDMNGQEKILEIIDDEDFSDDEDNNQVQTNPFATQNNVKFKQERWDVNEPNNFIDDDDDNNINPLKANLANNFDDDDVNRPDEENITVFGSRTEDPNNYGILGGY